MDNDSDSSVSKIYKLKYMDGDYRLRKGIDNCKVKI